MDFFVHAATWFYALFQAGGKVFISWTVVSTDADGKVTGLGFVPTVLMLLVAMNALIQLIGQDRINRLASKAGGQPVQPLPRPALHRGLHAGQPDGALARALPARDSTSPATTPAPPSSATPATGCSPTSTPVSSSSGSGIASGIIALGLNPADSRSATCWSASS